MSARLDRFLADLSISQIAYRCGFANQAHLTLAFRKECGVTPGNTADSFSEGKADQETAGPCGASNRREQNRDVVANWSFPKPPNTAAISLGDCICRQLLDKSPRWMTGSGSGISDRVELLCKLTEACEADVAKYLLLANSGGAVATLGFMGAAADLRALPGPHVALVAFLFGVVLCGATLGVRANNASSAYVAILRGF